MKRFRVYADTSVFGGYFDDEFAAESKAFFAEVKAGKLTLVISPTVLDELAAAPEFVQDLLNGLPPDCVEAAESSVEVTRLRDAYLQAGVVSKEHRADAEHIAAATIADVDFVVSWNFRHIVHFDKIAGYRAVNLMNGYEEILIYSPREVVEYDEE
jgi:predicted nucleic acid-binding protein